MKPCLDVLFHAYDYEKEQIGIVDTISCEEYENLVKEFKLKRSMALKIKTDVTCCVCGESLIHVMQNGEKEPITLFGCGHAGHRSCIDGDCCPVQGCWDDIKTEKKAVNRHASIAQLHYSVVSFIFNINHRNLQINYQRLVKSMKKVLLKMLLII